MRGARIVCILRNPADRAFSAFLYMRSRMYEPLDDFRAALRWVNRVGMLAEEEGHHPDLHLTRWNRVELVLWTHAVDGLSENDFVLAKKIDALWERSKA